MIGYMQNVYTPYMQNAYTPGAKYIHKIKKLRD